MITAEQLEKYQDEAYDLYTKKAKLVITDEEKRNIEIADLGLSRFDEIGLAVLVYVNTDRCCAKELAMWPGQICPQHLHPNTPHGPGKEETFRMRWGSMRLYVPGEPTEPHHATVPADRAHTFTVWHEVTLNPGDQYTLAPETWHWFQAGPQGCVVSEFSTRSTDELDRFTDEEIQRITKVDA